jgi:hypothetical protein
MTKQILKPVLIGILIGGAFYVVPFFFFPGFFIFIFIAFAFRFFLWGGPWRGWRRFGDGINPAFADTIRKMSDEEYEAFKKKYDHNRMSEGDDSEGTNVKR